MRAKLVVYVVAAFFIHMVCATTTLWPQPQTYTTTPNSNIVGEIDKMMFRSVRKIKITNSASVDLSRIPVIDRALQRYSSIVFSHSITIDQATSWAFFVTRVKSTKKLKFTSLSIELKSSSTTVEIDQDESYSLSVPDNGNTISISAANQWGALRALETLSQLIVPTVDGNTILNFAVSELPVTVNDFARYKWRGLMIDVARHYLTVPKIEKIIDAMSWDKFNKLHIHLVDAQTFPVQIPKFENMSSLSAFAPGKVYTPDQLKHIVQYAFERGIDVIPEFDMPGHAYSWMHAFPEVVATCPPGTTNINRFPLQPASEKTYEIIEAIVEFTRDTFKLPLLHIGADEVVLDCWRQDPIVQQFMNSTVAKENNLKTMEDLQGYFQKRVQAITDRYGKKLIAWEEVAIDLGTNVYKYPTENTLVQVWHSDTLSKVVSAGYNAIYSGSYYLDKQKPSPIDVDRWLWYDTWKDFYEDDPSKLVNETDLARIVGVEACSWGEQVSEISIEERVWPRVSAVAERGWSSKSMVCSDAFFCANQEPRLISHTCQTFVRRGVRAGSLRPDYCPYIDTFDEAIAEKQKSITRGVLIGSLLGNFLLLIGLIGLGSYTLLLSKKTQQDHSDQSLLYSR